MGFFSNIDTKPLVDYARLYLDKWPRSETHSLIGPEDMAVTAFYDGADWYAEKWPGLKLVIFVAVLPDIGMTGAHGVSFEDGKVVVYSMTEAKFS